MTGAVNLPPQTNPLDESDESGLRSVQQGEKHVEAGFATPSQVEKERLDLFLGEDDDVGVESDAHESKQGPYMGATEYVEQHDPLRQGASESAENTDDEEQGKGGLHGARGDTGQKNALDDV